MKRRSFLKGVAAAGAGLCAPATLTKALPREAVHCVVRESGSCSNWPLVIGALLTDSAERRNAEIEWLRRETGYRREIRYSSTDEGRIPFGRALIDYFVEEQGLRFRAFIVSDQLGTWPRNPAERDTRYFARYRDMLDGDIRNLGSARISLPARRNRRNELLQSALLSMAGGPEVERSGPSPSNMAQLAGLLAGCIRAERVGMVAQSRKTLPGYLRERLGASDLTALDSDKATVRSANI